MISERTLERALLQLLQYDTTLKLGTNGGAYGEELSI
jgi:hypothetical protein